MLEPKLEQKLEIRKNSKIRSNSELEKTEARARVAGTGKVGALRRYGAQPEQHLLGREMAPVHRWIYLCFLHVFLIFRSKNVMFRYRFAHVCQISSE